MIQDHPFHRTDGRLAATWPMGATMPAMSLLLAEMQALAAMLPGLQDSACMDEETRAEFDNLPV
ncbi:MAG: hypothetical protein WAT09_08010 [Paracoccaceae bacterium]